MRCLLLVTAVLKKRCVIKKCHYLISIESQHPVYQPASISLRQKLLTVGETENRKPGSSTIRGWISWFPLDFRSEWFHGAASSVTGWMWMHEFRKSQNLDAGDRFLPVSYQQSILVPLILKAWTWTVVRSDQPAVSDNNETKTGRRDSARGICELTFALFICEKVSPPSLHAHLLSLARFQYRKKAMQDNAEGPRWCHKMWSLDPCTTWMFFIVTLTD